eukprot:IDg23394t1
MLKGRLGEKAKSNSKSVEELCLKWFCKDVRDHFAYPWLSTCRSIVFVDGVVNTNENVFFTQIASLTAVARAIYSASDEDWAMHPCFFDFQLTAPPAIRKAYPLVDFLLVMHPPQSESLNPTGILNILSKSANCERNIWSSADG